MCNTLAKFLLGHYWVGSSGGHGHFAKSHLNREKGDRSSDGMSGVESKM